MRKFFIFVFMVTFLATTTVVSAWAQPCMHDMNASASATEMANQNEIPPCHQTENTKQSEKEKPHCEGLCLCAHASNSPSLFMKNSDGIRLPIISKQLFVIDNDTLASVSQIPPKRPPKHIS